MVILLVVMVLQKMQGRRSLRWIGKELIGQLCYSLPNRIFHTRFSSPIYLLASAMISMLFPAFASIDGVEADLNSAFRHAYWFLAFLLTPLHPPHDKSRFRTGAAGPLGRILYEAAYASSVPHLQLHVFASHSIAFGYLVHTAFFNGFGRSTVTFVLHLVASGALFLSAPVLAENFGQGSTCSFTRSSSPISSPGRSGPSSPSGSYTLP